MTSYSPLAPSAPKAPYASSPFWRELFQTIASYVVWALSSLLISFVLYPLYTATRGNFSPTYGVWAVLGIIASIVVTGELRPRLAKRIVDVIISAVAIVFFLPLFLVCAVAIKLTSPGPVLFSQERIGLNGRRFKFFKFRTMAFNAERYIKNLELLNEAGGPVFKIKNDPRVTRIGKFMRQTSIDELPQLFNVLKGEMSLVGPRPLPLSEYEFFRSTGEIGEAWKLRRSTVEPGITSLWWQAEGIKRSSDQWIRLDLKYMDEWSLWLDFKILAKSIRVVFGYQGHS